MNPFSCDKQGLVQSKRNNQQGSALIVALVMLLVISLIGVAGIQSTAMQDRMAANLLDKNLAFQAAEAAAREAEDSLADSVPISFPNSGGLYRIGAEERPDWPANLSSVGGGVTTYSSGDTSGQFPNVSAQPRYFIEQIDTIPAPGCDLSTYCEPVYYRVTAAATGGTDTAAAVISTVYRTR